MNWSLQRRPFARRFNAVKMDCMDHLSNALGSDTLEVHLVVEEIPEEDKAKFLSTPKEKYDYMVKQNPELKRLKDDLDLDFSLLVNELFRFNNLFTTYTK